MGSASWSHGFYSNSAYRSGHYRQMAPNWLDFACLAQGQRPPRACEGAPFRYLDLGCGLGNGLCLLAALYPEGEFLGVDFLPDHIAHGNWLARELGLQNVRFLEADFVSLHADPSPLALAQGGEGNFHYVCTRGVASWVTEPVQAALFAVAASALVPGGLFFCHYTTMPGWLSGSVLHELIDIELQRHDPATPGAALAHVKDTLAELLGPEDSGSPLAKALPSLRSSLNHMAQYSDHSNITEHANAGWKPLFVSEMHRRIKANKLTYLASASLANSNLSLYPKPVRKLVENEPNPDVRESLLDMSVNASSRSDIFVRGRLPMPKAAWEERVGNLKFCIQEAMPQKVYTFNTSFGSVTTKRALYSRLEASLTQGPITLAQWSNNTRIPLNELLTHAALLLEARRIGLVRGDVGRTNIQRCAEVNRSWLITMRDPQTHSTHLGSSLTGNGISLTRTDVFIVGGLIEGLEGDALKQWTIEQLKLNGFRALAADKTPHADDETNNQAVSKHVDQFLHSRWPFMEALQLI